ncbi:basic secretory protein-like protein [Aliikangiella coralliicola]|uniref:PKD domain-containing protein n=1 Tax=Aliikangiella coralliicola TaxID=2592383 RepID=A0A545U8Y4_9GAMM|nr:basic secretory protein-like protein [Aliikangiella coralliicola]TQV85927.1 hypothetical protein FLL46_18590 [Aliikangiella coralliicola]
MNKITVFMAVTALLTLMACNGSDKPLEITPRVTEEPVAESALRNMATDVGNVVVSPNGVNVPEGEQVTNLIDGDTTSKFLSFSTSVTVIITTSKPHVLQSYNIVSANDQPKRDPVRWLLEASADGDNWNEIDRREEQSFSARGKRNHYQLTANETEYRHYRFNFTHTGTDDFGADITQLAEIELMVEADLPIVSFFTDKPRAEVKESVSFIDQTLVSPTSWNWTFQDGIPATSTAQHPVVTFSSIGPKRVSVEVSNKKGSTTLEKEYAIWIWDPVNPWNGFPKPVVSFVKLDPEHQGQADLDRVLPDLESQIHEVSLGVSKILYENVTEISIFKTVTFETGHYDFPAAKGGTDTDMILYMDLDHIANTTNNGGDDALRKEVLGMLWHELTHGYSNSPQTGEYVPGTEYHSFLEGIADFVRIKAGYNEHKRGGIAWAEDWNADAYNQTSFFLEWVHNSHQSINFIYLFNQAAGELNEWSFENAFQKILGRGIQEVWEQYQTEYVQRILGQYPPFPTPVEGYVNFAIDEGTLVSTNATDLALFGEGISNVNDNNVINPFNAVIEETWWMRDYYPQLLPINEVTNVVVNIQVPEAKVLEKYSISSAKETHEWRDPTAWTVEASEDGETWLELDTAQYPQSPPARLETFHYDVEGNETAYQFYRFTFENSQEGEGVGGDNGRLIAIGEIALLTSM